jgi:hypothetical protein
MATGDVWTLAGYERVTSGALQQEHSLGKVGSWHRTVERICATQRTSGPGWHPHLAELQ